jgi:sugar lactone lactonase YvrE
MSSLLGQNASLERLYTGTEWGEGPVWLPEARALRWSDIPNNRILQYHADAFAEVDEGWPDGPIRAAIGRPSRLPQNEASRPGSAQSMMMSLMSR